MRVAIGCDHVGFPHKASVVAALEDDEHAVLDLGTHGTDPVDYPALARAVATAIGNGFVDVGILLCESGIGGSIAANKFKGIRAAACHDSETARDGRERADVNMLCLDAGRIDTTAAVAIAREGLSAQFCGEDRDVREIAKITEIEEAARHAAHRQAGQAKTVRPAPRPAAPRNAPVAAPAPVRGTQGGAAGAARMAEVSKPPDLAAVESFITSVRDDTVKGMAARILEFVRDRFPAAAGTPNADGFSFTVRGEHAASVTVGKGFVQLEAGPDRIPTSRIRDIEGLEVALSLPSIVRALDAIKS
jgi:ribose 5-phosphate isomerase B